MGKAMVRSSKTQANQGLFALELRAYLVHSEIVDSAMPEKV